MGNHKHRAGGAPRTIAQAPCRPGSSAITLSEKRYTKDDRLIGRLLFPEAFSDPPPWRPKTRADCAQVARPCPYVGCRYHLYLDVSRTGSLKLNFPGLQPWELHPASSCALDIADAKECTLEEISVVLNFTRERTRQIETAVFTRVRDEDLELGEYLGPEPAPRLFGIRLGPDTSKVRYE